jgi:hypothetical protein
MLKQPSDGKAGAARYLRGSAPDPRFYCATSELLVKNALHGLDGVCGAGNEGTPAADMSSRALVLDPIALDGTSNRGRGRGRGRGWGRGRGRGPL